MLPIRRDIHFDLPAERIKNWHEQGPFITHFFNALSLLFPQGELFFMDSVRHYRQRIDDPELKQQIQGFIGQEAMHSREHVAYNDLMQAAGLAARVPAQRLRARGTKILLAGMLAPPNLGREYSDAFAAVFRTLAAKHAVALYPFFVPGERPGEGRARAARRARAQRDGHPPGADAGDRRPPADASHAAGRHRPRQPRAGRRCGHTHRRRWRRSRS